MKNVTTYGNHRFFRQPGGALPGNPVYFSGVDTEHMIIESASVPKLGGITPIRVHDPMRAKRYKNVGSNETAPDYATGTVQLLETQGVIPWQWGDTSCPITFYEMSGECRDLSDPHSGWDSMRVYSNAKVTVLNPGTRGSWDSDDPVMSSLDVTFEGGVYAVGPITFGAEAAAQVAHPVVGITYGRAVQCGNCGPANDGTRYVYAVQKENGETPATIVYTLSSGGSWPTPAAITGIGTTEAVYSVDVIGEYLVVLGADAYYYALLNPQTGAPGAFTKVTTGFVATKSPRDIFAVSGREIWFCALGGYIYKSSSIAAGVEVVDAGDTTTEDLNRIHGTADGTFIVAAGDNGAVIVSVNGGDSWAVSAAAPSANELISLWVVDENTFWAGEGTSGALHYTRDGGATWGTKTLPTSTGITDIAFATQEVGYASGGGGAGRVVSTVDGGETWHDASAYGRLRNRPTYTWASCLAVPRGADPTVAANNVAVGGTAAVSTDGVIYLGKAAIR